MKQARYSVNGRRRHTLPGLRSCALQACISQAGDKGIRYDSYTFHGREAVLVFLKGAGILAGGAYFFYRSAAAAFIMLPVLVPFYRSQRKQAVRRRKEQLTLQFKEAISTVSAAMQAGYSAENAFVRAREEMRLLYGDKSDIYSELCRLIQASENNLTIEQMLLDLGRRSGVEEIADFAQVFAIGKRSSGDIRKIIHSTVSLITEKIEVEREIRTVLSAGIMEQRIMSAMPFAILFYIDATSPGFFDMLYHNAAGNIMMTVCLLCYLGALALGRRIVDIRV